MKFYVPLDGQENTTVNPIGISCDPIQQMDLTVSTSQPTCKPLKILSQHEKCSKSFTIVQKITSLASEISMRVILCNGLFTTNSSSLGGGKVCCCSGC